MKKRRLTKEQIAALKQKRQQILALHVCQAVAGADAAPADPRPVPEALADQVASLQSIVATALAWSGARELRNTIAIAQVVIAKARGIVATA